MIEVKVRSADACTIKSETLTSGRVGVMIHFNFSEEWEDLDRVAVFSNGVTDIDVYLESDTVQVPPEMFMEAGRSVKVGVRGDRVEGDVVTVVIPTVYTLLGTVFNGTDISGNTSAAVTPTVVEQIMAAAGMAVETANSVREDADNGVFNGEPGPKGESGFAATAVSTVDNSANQFTEPGLYYFDESHTLSDAPSQGKIGFLSVMAEGHTTKQEWKPSNTNDMYSRRNYDVSLNVWRDWARVNTFAPLNKSSDLGAADHNERVNAFVRAMNKKAVELGMLSTEYKTPSGFLRICAGETLSDNYNNHSTVADTVRLLIAARHTPQVYGVMGKKAVNYEVDGAGYLYNNIILMDAYWRDWEAATGLTLLAAKGGSLSGSYGEIGINGILNYALIVGDGENEYAVAIMGLENTNGVDGADGGDHLIAKTLTKDLIDTLNSGGEPTDAMSAALERTSPVGMGVVKLTGAYDIDVAAMSAGKFYNGGKRYVVASVTKIMTALLVAENAENHFVTISQHDIVGGSGSEHTAAGGTTTIIDLLSIMMAKSDNSAATALAENCIIVGESGGPDASVFIAEKGVTTYAEVAAAIAAGKSVEMRAEISGRLYSLPLVSKMAPDDDRIRFGGTVDNKTYTCSVSSNGTWSTIVSTPIQPISDRVNTISSSSTDAQYPSAKAVYDYHDGTKQDKLTAGENITIDENGVISSSGGGGDSVFIVERGVTTYAEVVAAIDAGKSVEMHAVVGGSLYVLPFVRRMAASDDRIRFGGTVENTTYVCSVSPDDSWSTVAATGVQRTADRVQTIDASATATQYPSAKAVYDAITSAIGNIDTLIGSGVIV